MRKSFRSVVAMATLSCVCSPVVATESDSDTVVVTATRTAQTADQALAAVTVVTREDIETSQAKDVAELLRFEAGIDIGRNGGIGQNTSLFMRGTDSNHTLVLLDGVRINPGTIGGAAIQHLDPSLIERVEIVRGPRSSLYGSDAIGGVVQIFTRRHADGTRAHALVGAGPDAFREGALGVHRGNDGARMGLDVSRVQTDGFPARTTATQDTGYRNTSINAYTGFKLGATDLEVHHWHTQGNSEYFDFFLTPRDQDIDNSVSAITLKTTVGSRWVSTLKLSRMQDELNQNQFDFGPDGNDFAHTQRNTLDWQNDVQIGDNHLLTLGALLSREHTESQNFGTVFDEDTDSKAIFVQDQWRTGSHRWLAALRLTDHETFGNHTSGELAYGFNLNADTHFYTSIASGFRAPDSTDRFGFGGNEELDPEASRNIELGARTRFSTTQSASLAVFENHIRDLIIFEDPDGFPGPLPGMNQNIERARIRGIELGYSVSAKPWRVDLKGIVQDPQNLELDRQLARRAKRSATLNIHYVRESYSVGVNALVTSERPDSDFSDTVNAGYGIVNLFGRYDMTQRVTLRASIENVLDKQYVLADGFNTQDRALFLKAEYRYDNR